MKVTVHRVFRTRSRDVYEGSLDATSVLAMENCEAKYIQWMLQIPTIFTKDAAVVLAKQLGWLPWNKNLDELIWMINAYEKSYHHAAVPELGILIDINQAFQGWPTEECDIVDKHGRKHYKVADITNALRRRPLLRVEQIPDKIA